MTHPLAASAVQAAARNTGAAAKGKDSLKRDRYSRIGTGPCLLGPLSHETFGRPGPAAFGLSIKTAEFAASSGVVCKRKFLENAMRNLSTTLRRGITWLVLATVPLRARLNGHPVVAELPMPTGDLIPVAGEPPPSLPWTHCFPLDQKRYRCPCEQTAHGGLRASHCMHTLGGFNPSCGGQ